MDMERAMVNYSGAVAANTPIYRGKFTKVSEIENAEFNLNDWIYYAGETTAAPNRWEKDYVYQLERTGWEKRERPSVDPTYGWLYLDAVSSMVDGTPDGMFSNVFCKALVTVNAFIDNLQTKIIKLGYVNDTNMGILLDGTAGEIKSYNYQTDSSGFLLKRNKGSDGIQAEFTDIKTRNLTVIGELNANVSLFKGYALPIIGAVRDYIEFTQTNGNIKLESKSSGIDSISRTGVGEYEIKFSTFYFNNLRRLAVLGCAWDSNGSVGYKVIKKYGDIMISNTGNIINIFKIEIRGLLDILVDPYYASILIAG